jgi:hypothetical protein
MRSGLAFFSSAVSGGIKLMLSSAASFADDALMKPDDTKII